MRVLTILTLALITLIALMGALLMKNAMGPPGLA